VQDLGDTTWVAGGIAVTGATRIVSGAPATKIIDAVKVSGAISVEGWITPANLAQTGPARIVSISSNTRLRNVTLGQARNDYETRLRTTETSNNGIPAVTTNGGTAQTVLQHVLYTRDNTGAVAMYIDGQEVATGSVGGSFDNWDEAYRLILANEYDGSRPWNGTLHLAAVYAKALDALEVQQNFVAGPDGDQTVPEVTIDAFTVAPEAIILGQSAQLAWQTNGATEVAITPDIGIVAASGTRSVSPAAATTYTLTATGPGGSASATASVAVTVPDPPVIDSFTASPTTIDPGDSATLTWSVTGAEEVSIAPGFASLPASGTVSVSPGTSTTFTLTADNAGGSVSQAVLLTVEAPPEAPEITLNPADVRLLAGETATFTVEATGTAPLAFQWQRDGAGIAGAIASTYTTNALAAADDGARYRCVVSNAAGSATSEAAVLTVIEPGDRVTDDLQALYLFAEGAGDTVYDVSGVGDPLDLIIADPSRAAWTDDGLNLSGETIVQSATPATKIIDAIRASNAITVEAWVATADLNLDGPARVVSISRDTGQRNVTLGQKGSAWETRLRTTTTSNNGWPPLTTANGNVSTALQHVVYTRASNGLATTYINGVEVVMDNVGGDLLNWDETYRLGLGNELNQQRPWRGELALVAVYSKALSAVEVDQNFGAFSGNSAPTFEPVAGNAANFEEASDSVHSADQDGDGVMGLNEILRVVQLYNGGGIACGIQTEDGYAIGTIDEEPECPPHAADVSPTDWEIQLGELLRIIQIFNQGGYESCARPTSEDGYCAE
jgi:hypothetical protein